MFLTVTLNAALDVTYEVRRLAPGAMHRVGAPSERAGGKGINVARVLRALGETVCVTGFAGGLAGRAFRADLSSAAIPAELVTVVGETRRTVTVVETVTGEATLLNEPGPQPTNLWPTNRQPTNPRPAGPSTRGRSATPLSQRTP
jgi:tagatose 6-phosphate kinase